jgi:hypothetical protein
MSCQHRDKVFDIPPDQRFPARQTDFFDTQADEQTSQAVDLFKAEQLFSGEELILPPKNFLGHAVDAAKVATVGDGDA